MMPKGAENADGATCGVCLNGSATASKRGLAAADVGRSAVAVITYMEFDGLGRMVAVATDQGVCMFEYADYPHLDRELRGLAAALGPLTEAGCAHSGETDAARALARPNTYLHALRRQMEEYLAGTRREFDIPLCIVGTEFQKRVWRGLMAIPYGQTTSYGVQAAALGHPSAPRAVAGANGRNKISVVIPCHRVVGSDGSLTGYGGGVERKRFLLELERRTALAPRVRGFK